MGLAAGLRGDVRALGDEERAGDAGALGVVLDAELGRDVLGGVADAGEGREDDAVGQGDVTDVNGLEERGGRHGATGLGEVCG